MNSSEDKPTVTSRKSSDKDGARNGMGINERMNH
jgi:hypothetical protein